MSIRSGFVSNPSAKSATGYTRAASAKNISKPLQQINNLPNGKGKNQKNVAVITIDDF